MHEASQLREQGSGVPTLRRLILLECLFTLVGGYSDAYAFLMHHHVFANAQTGNVVFFATFAAQGMWSDAVRHVPPILACICGVVAGKLLKERSGKGIGETRFTLGLDIAVFMLLCFFDSQLPGHMVVAALAFVAALQITSFDVAGGWKFNSAMTTGNLKSATESLVLLWKGEARHENRGKALVAATACVAFLFGALGGGLYTLHHARLALAPCVLILLGRVAPHARVGR